MTKLSLQNLSKKKTIFFIGLSLVLLSVMLIINVGYVCRALTYIPVYLFGVGAYLLFFGITFCGLVLIFRKKFFKIKYVSRFLGIFVIFTGLTTIFSYVHNPEASIAGYKEIFNHGVLFEENYFKIKFINIFTTYKIGGGFFGNAMCSVFLSAGEGFTKFICVTLIIVGILLFFLNEIKHLKFRISNNKTHKEAFYDENNNEINDNAKTNDRFSRIKNSNKRRIAEASIIRTNQDERRLENFGFINQKSQNGNQNLFDGSNITSYSATQKDVVAKNKDFLGYPLKETKFTEDYELNGSLEVAHFNKHGESNKEQLMLDAKGTNNPSLVNNLQTNKALEKATFNRTDFTNTSETNGSETLASINPNEQVMINRMRMTDSPLSSYNEDNLNNSAITSNKNESDAYNPKEEQQPASNVNEPTPDGSCLDLFIRKPASQKIIEEETTNKFVWETPSLEILDNLRTDDLDNENIQVAETRMDIINKFFSSKNIDTQITRYKIGPRVTRFYIPYNNNVSVKMIMSVVPDLEVRVGSNIMFVQCVDVSTSGLDIANVKSTIVPFKTVMEKMPDPKKHPLAIPFGKSIDGEVLFDDFNKFPHLLLAGSTNSGKSNYIHSVICALLMRASPEILKIAIIDPKFIEFSRYNNVPHLLCPIVIDMDKAKPLLDKLAEEMNNRYQAFASCPNGSCTSLDEFNAYRKSIGKSPIPYIICVIDEYADLVDNVKNVDQPVNSIAAKARACGIFLFITTQRPSANILNGTIKSNVPVHIALKTSTTTDSQIILGVGGAEHLLGFGDMLIQDPGLFNGGDLLRCQAAMISKDESNHIIDYLKERYKPEYDEFFLNLDERKPENITDPYGVRDLSYIDEDPIFPDVLKYASLQDYCSAAKLVQRYQMGSTKASKFIARLVEIGALEEALVSNAGHKVIKEYFQEKAMEELNSRTSSTSREQTSFDFENRYK